MAKGLEVRVPDEIMDYKESIVMGLSVRQLICGAAALVMGVPTFFILKGISEDLATYATMIVVIPAFLIGFIKKDGYNFETYFKIHVTNFFAKPTRSYETSPNDELPVEIEEYRILLSKEEKTNVADDEKTKGVKKVVHKKQKSKTVKRTEYDFIEVTEKSIKRKRKAAAKAIKAKAREYRKKKFVEKEKIEERDCSSERTTDYSL